MLATQAWAVVWNGVGRQRLGGWAKWEDVNGGEERGAEGDCYYLFCTFFKNGLTDCYWMVEVKSLGLPFGRQKH